jgi:hypothetical protein
MNLLILSFAKCTVCTEQTDNGQNSKIIGPRVRANQLTRVEYIYIYIYTRYNDHIIILIITTIASKYLVLNKGIVAN